jgi:hypothetical protein
LASRKFIVTFGQDTSVADPDDLKLDPEQTFEKKPDPDSTLEKNADPDLDSALCKIVY